MYLRIALGLSLLLALAALAVAQEKKESALKPAITLSGKHSAIRKEQSAVITDAAKWKELWKQHRGETEPPFTEPFQELDIDFGTHYVVAIFAGPSTNCVLTPRMRGGEVAIGYAEEIFSTEGRPPLRTTAKKAKDEATAPYGFVVLPRPIKTVVIEKDVSRSKLDPPHWKEVSRFPAPGDRK